MLLSAMILTSSDLCWQGSECDLLVDTGVGVHSLPRYLAWAGLRPSKGAQADKPLQVIRLFPIV